MSLLQNNYDERLAEKLARLAAKRGGDSAPAQELKRVKPSESVTSQKRKGVTEKSTPGVQE